MQRFTHPSRDLTSVRSRDLAWQSSGRPCRAGTPDRDQPARPSAAHRASAADHDLLSDEFRHFVFPYIRGTRSFEEVVRWSSPIIHFARTAASDTLLNGVEIKEGDTLGLFYPSGNRDEDVFEDPNSFRIDRKRNPHVGFGVGEHFCAGAHVARLELEMAFKYLLPRIDEIELAGPVDRLHSNLVGGIKRLPIRYSLKPA